MKNRFATVLRNIVWANLGIIIGIAVTRSSGLANAEEQAVAPEQAKNSTVVAAAIKDSMDIGIEYTLTVDGAVVDSTNGKTPFHYIHGQHQMIPGLEKQLAGLHVGDTKDVTVAPVEGYGEIDSAAFVEVPKTQLPKEVTPTVGMVLRGINPDGKSFRAKISQMKDTTVVLDLNHPLAGKTLNFHVKVVEIAPAKQPSPVQ